MSLKWLALIKGVSQALKEKEGELNHIRMCLSLELTEKHDGCGTVGQLAAGHWETEMWGSY